MGEASDRSRVFPNTVSANWLVRFLYIVLETVWSKSNIVI
jgi:hypothetical protein